MNTSKDITVTAGVITQKGKVLIAQRNRHKALGLKWEFPGGKVDPGETERVCLERELKEELKITTRTGPFIGSYSHQYDGFSITIKAYNVDILEGTPTKTEHEQIVWVEINELLDFDLADADIPLASEIIRRSENGF